MRDHAVWEENRRTWHFIRPNELEFHRKWDVRWKHQAIGLFLSWWIYHLWSGVRRVRKYHFSFILWAFVSFGFWVSIILGDVWKVLCAQGHSLLHKGFIYWLLWRTLHYELVLKSTVYMHVHSVRIIQWLSEGSEQIYMQCLIEISFETLEEVKGRFCSSFWSVHIYSVHIYNEKKEAYLEF